MHSRGIVGFIWQVVRASLFIASCSLLKLPLTPVVVFVYLVAIVIRQRMGVVDLLSVWLVAVPFLGPNMTVNLGPVPDLNFSRLFALLLIFCQVRKGDRMISHGRLLSNKLDYFLLMFLGACLLSIPGSVMVRTPLRLFLDASLIPCIYYFAAKRSVDQPDFLPKIFIASWLAVSALAGMGLYEGLSGHDLLKFEDESSHAEGTDDFRVNGPFGTAEQYGLILSMLLMIVLVLKPMRNAGLVRRRYLRWTCLLAVGAALCTWTRTVWLSLAMSWLVFQTRRRPVFTLGFTALVLTLGWFLTQSVLPQIFGDLWQQRVAQEKTVYARIATYQSAFAMFKDHPLLGVGFGAFTENWERFPERYAFEYEGVRSVSTPHNGFLAILSEMGLIGALAFVALQTQVFRSAARLSRVADGLLDGYYAEAVIAIAIAFIVAGFTLSFTHDTGFVNKIYFLVIGALSGMIDGSFRRLGGSH